MPPKRQVYSEPEAILEPLTITCVEPLAGPRSGKMCEITTGAVYVNGTALNENCWPFEDTSTDNAPARCADPETSRTLSIRCSSSAPAPVRAPMPKRQDASGDQALSNWRRTSHKPSTRTPRPSVLYTISTGTARPLRNDDISN